MDRAGLVGEDGPPVGRRDTSGGVRTEDQCDPIVLGERANRFDCVRPAVSIHLAVVRLDGSQATRREAGEFYPVPRYLDEATLRGIVASLL